MWQYEKRLQYPVKISKPNPQSNNSLRQGLLSDILTTSYSPEWLIQLFKYGSTADSRISTYYNIANIFMKGESNMPNYRYNSQDYMRRKPRPQNPPRNIPGLLCRTGVCRGTILRRPQRSLRR